MAEQQNWTKVPQLKDFQKYDSDQGGETAALNDYIAALNDFSNGPKRLDYKTQGEYNAARVSWRSAIARSQSDILDWISGTAGVPVNEDEAKDFFKKEINEAKKKIAERSTTSEGQVEQEALTGVQETKQATQQKTVVEQARPEALKNVAIPGFKDKQVFAGTPTDRQRTTNIKVEALLTNDEWVDQWATMTPTEKEIFKRQISDALGDSPQAGLIRSLDVNDPTLQQTWQSYGIYLSESYRQNKATPRAMSPESFSDYAKKSGTFEAAEGDQAKYEQDVTNFYRSNGLPIVPSIISNITKRLSSGALDLEAWKQSQRKLLAKEYPDWADELNSGLDLQDLASNYVSKMSEVLELDAETIDLNNSLIKNAIQARTPDGKLTTKTLREFELDLRQDPRWQQTQVAQQEATNAASFVLEKFGFRS